MDSIKTQIAGSDRVGDCIALELHSVLYGEIMGRNSKKEAIYVCKCGWIHFALQEELMYYCKATLIQFI